MRTVFAFVAVCLTVLSGHESNGRAIEEEIYRGFDAERGQFPYQVLLIQRLRNGGSSACGGSLISNRWVLTAAHCAEGAASTRVYTGLVNTADRTGVSVYTVRRRHHYIHRRYDPQTLRHDIALLRLPSAISLNQYVNTVNLPTRSQADPSTFDNQRATASGWGKTEDNENGIHDILQYNTINVYPHSSCDNYYRNINDVTNGMICTDKRVVYSGPCQGDSGGPLTINGTDSKPVVIGAVSWGVGDCSNRNPVVYTYVPRYLRWISRRTGIPIS